MPAFLTAFLTSLIVTLLLVRYDHLHSRYSSDHDLGGVQKFHARPVPRIGGIGIFAAMLAVGALLMWLRPVPDMAYWWLMAAALPAFAGGLAEDLTKRVGVLMRLGLTMLAAALGYWWLGSAITRVDVPGLDTLLQMPALALLVTAFAVGGIANAINIIDGYNGLAGVVSAIVFLALAYVGFLVGDLLIWTLAVAMAGAILGFLLWNFPKGLIFLGDGGAYLLGFMIGELAVLLVARHAQVSAWFPVLLLIYPVFETLFSIYRRVILKGNSAGMPDAAHMHQLVYKRLVRWAVGSREARDLTNRNAMTSPYLWLLCSMAVVPAVLFWNNTLVLQICTALFVVTYVWLYRALVRFKAPRWLITRRP